MGREMQSDSLYWLSNRDEFFTRFLCNFLHFVKYILRDWYHTKMLNGLVRKGCEKDTSSSKRPSSTDHGSDYYEFCG